MALNKVEICGVNTTELPLLKKEEKQELMKQIKKGNKRARERYIQGNLRLVLSIIQRFSNSNENFDDLFQVGCIGLMKAIDNFNDELDVQFSTYACPMIIGEVRRYLRDIAYKAIYAKESLTKQLNREPTIEEVAEQIEMKKEEVIHALDAIASPMSLYEPVYQEGGDTLYLMDQVRDKKSGEENWIEDIALKEAMKRLSRRENEIIRLRFFEGRTQTEVADEISISQAQVSRLEKTALKNMKQYLQS
ncbi:MAG: RNA polymerase sporulation sigma factor SigG [Clostridiales bacterium]|nr:RNA polymerase sporulation sigma factor SigG [Clostridiales bacterium]